MFTDTKRFAPNVSQRHPWRNGAVALLIAGWAGVTFSQDKKSEVLQALSEQEALYDEMELSWISTYKLGVMKHPSGDVVSHREERGHYVRQKGMFYLDFSRDHQSVKGLPEESKHWSKQIAFDGASTRCLENNAGLTGNIVTGLRDDMHKFLPHTICLAMQYRQQMVPLSVWLSGDDAVAAWPSGKIDSRNERTVTWSGQDTVDGLDCDKLTIAFRPRGQESRHVLGKLVLWLAADRNFLPVQTQHFSLGVSDDIPMAATAMSDLREIEPGVWFPCHSRMTVFDKPSLEEDGKHVVAWTEDHVVTAVALHPNYEKAFFQVEFPNGTPVYEVDNGKILQSYVAHGK